jgi:hypothetical protein
MTHSSMTAEARATVGISDSLLRLSVGIERAEDLVADLEQALSRCTRVETPSLTAAAPVRSRKPRETRPLQLVVP